MLLNERFRASMYYVNSSDSIELIPYSQGSEFVEVMYKFDVPIRLFVIAFLYKLGRFNGGSWIMAYRLIVKLLGVTRFCTRKW